MNEPSRPLIGESPPTASATSHGVDRIESSRTERPDSAMSGSRSERSGMTWTWWPIARTSLMLCARRRVFWFLFSLSLVDFLFLFAAISLRAQLLVTRPGLKIFLDRLLDSVTGTGDTFRDFMFVQGTITMIVLTFAGTTLVGREVADDTMSFFLSRRVRWRDYLLGKFVAVGVLVALTTLVPALILFLEFGLLTDSVDYFRSNGRIFVGIIGYGTAMAVSLSVLAVTLSWWMTRPSSFVVAWMGMFVLLPILSRLMQEAYGDRRWLLLILWRDIRLIGSWFFGSVNQRDGPETVVAGAVIVGVVCLFCLGSLVAAVRMRRNAW